MFGKNLVFYLVASTVIAFAAHTLGASTAVIIAVSLVGPPAVLLALALLRYKGWF